MKQKLLKRILALALTGAMVASMCACGNDAGSSSDSSSGNSSGESSTADEGGSEDSGSQESADDGGSSASDGKDLSWLNSSQTLPIVAEGTEKTLSLYVWGDEAAPDPEQVWNYKFIEDAMNINLEVTRFTDANKSEFLSMAFASGELPDIIIGGDFDAAALVKYGAVEEQIMDLAPYMQYMPNLNSIYETYPSYKSAIMDSEGHIWSLGNIVDVAYLGGIKRMFINYDWLNDYDLNVPTNLDEFVDVLHTFKEKNESCWPLGGCYEYYSPMQYILNAFGYMSNDAKGTEVVVRDGEVILPVADREVYGEVLKFMKQLYDEQMIHPDFFTMDRDAAGSLVKQGLVGFNASDYLIEDDSWNQYWGAIPLTSEWNDTAKWPAVMSQLSCGGAVVSADCEEPELALTFLDFWYTFHNSWLTVIGPSVEEEGDYLYGLGGYVCYEPNVQTYLDMEKEDCPYESNGDYFVDQVQLWNRVIGTRIPDGSGQACQFWTDGDPMSVEEAQEKWPQFTEPYLADMRKDSEGLCPSIDHHYMSAIAYTLLPYTTSEDMYPGNVYLDADTAVEAGNLKVMIEEYASKETAKFVTGARSLDEIDAYFDELDALGAQRYVEIYKDYYENLQ